MTTKIIGTPGSVVHIQPFKPAPCWGAPSYLNLEKRLKCPNCQQETSQPHCAACGVCSQCMLAYFRSENPQMPKRLPTFVPRPPEADLWEQFQLPASTTTLEEVLGELEAAAPEVVLPLKPVKAAKVEKVKAEKPAKEPAPAKVKKQRASKPQVQGSLIAKEGDDAADAWS